MLSNFLVPLPNLLFFFLVLIIVIKSNSVVCLIFSTNGSLLNGKKVSKDEVRAVIL